VNEEKSMVTRLPTPQVVETWIGHAKSLPRLLEIPKLSQASEPGGPGGGRPGRHTLSNGPATPGPGRPGGRKGIPIAGKIKGK
jgi:hypothetical protein